MKEVCVSKYLTHSFICSFFPLLFISQQSCQWGSASYFIREGTSRLGLKEKLSRSPSNEANHPGRQHRPLDSKSIIFTLLSILFIYGSEWVRRRETIATKPSPELAEFFLKTSNLNSIEILSYTHKTKVSKVDYIFNKNAMYGLLAGQPPPSIQFLLQPVAHGIGACALGKHVRVWLKQKADL